MKSGMRERGRLDGAKCHWHLLPARIWPLSWMLATPVRLSPQQALFWRQMPPLTVVAKAAGAIPRAAALSHLDTFHHPGQRQRLSLPLQIPRSCSNQPFELLEKFYDEVVVAFTGKRAGEQHTIYGQ